MQRKSFQSLKNFIPLMFMVSVIMVVKFRCRFSAHVLVYSIKWMQQEWKMIFFLKKYDITAILL